jgi:ribosomal protein S18 acetylase RimI-like enzyme
MLDKSIPYYNIVMQRKPGRLIPKFVLPEGFTFVPFTDGSEADWARIEASVGEFDSTSEALAYFNNKYLSYPGEVERRTTFIQTSDFKKVATVTSWWNYTGERRDPTLEWIAVMPEYQGIGLGKAVTFAGLERMLLIEGDRDIFLHTQTWSYKAIGIYLQAGFEFMRDNSFGEYANDYDKALPYIEDRINAELFNK